MSGKRKKPLYKRFFSRRVKSHGGHRALAAMTAILGLILMSFGFVSAPALATGGGNEDCPSGTTQLAKYNWNGNSYVAESGGSIVSVSGNATSGTFTVADGYEVSAVVVKGSNNAKTDTYNPPVTSGSFNNSGLINNGGQTADISNVKFCGSKKPADECPDLDGNQPPDTDCTQPPDDREARDLPGVVNCESDTYTVEHQERTREYSWDGDSWEPGQWSDWTTYDTTVTPATDEQCPDEPPVEPEGDITVTSECESITINPPTGVKPADGKIVILLDGKDARPETWTVEPGEHTVELYVNGELVDSVTITVKECPPPPDECPSLTGSVKTTLSDGSVVNGNIYDNKSDVYVYGEQLGDVTTVYVRVTDPSGSTVLSGTKEVTVVDGSFGPVQLPTFGDTPNNGDEYKVWVSTSPDFENNKCTKFDNFKVRGEKPPTPAEPTVQAVARGCVDDGTSDGVVDVTVANTDDDTDDTVTYDVTLDGATKQVTIADGVSGSVQFTGLAAGSYTVSVSGDDGTSASTTVKVEECEVPPELVVTVIPNQGSCEARTPKAQVTTSFASSIAYQVTGQERVFVHQEVQAGTYMVTLPDVAEGASVSYEIIVVPLDDSAEAIVKGPFTFSVPGNCDEVPPCTEFQDENPNAPCYVEREPDVREKSSKRESCKLGGVVTTHAVFTTTYSFNEVTQQWESSETATSSQSFDPYTAAELKEKGCVKAPPPDDDNPPSDHPTNPPHAGATSGSSSLSSNLMVGAGGAFLMAALVMLFGARRRQVGEV